MLKVNETIFPDKKKLFRYLNQIYLNGQVTNNSKFVKEFEYLIKKYTETEFAISTSSGTIALHLVLKSLNYSEGEIITTPLSFIASTSPIIWENFTPIFCDVDENTFCIDVDKIEQKINSKTKAILSVNLFGNVCKIDRLESISKKYNLTLIFDSAHCFGSLYKGKSCFQFGDFSITSFHSSKIFSSVEGGAIFVKESIKYDKLYNMRYFGKDNNNNEVTLGTNAKMSEFHAVYGLASFELFSYELERRNQIAELYRSYFCENSSFFQLQKTEENTVINNSYFPVILKKNDIDIEDLINKGLNEGISLRRYFYPLINEISFINSSINDTPIAKKISERIICLPIHSKLKKNDIQKIIKFLDRYTKNE